MKAVADTNIFLAAVLNEPEKEAIIALTNNCDLIAPEVLPFEIGNALWAMVKRKRLSVDEALSAYDETRKVPIELCAIDIKKALAIASQYRIYAYDAYFLECARAASCRLLSLDAALKKVATRLGIGLLEEK